MQAPAPERLIKGGLPTEAMVASVLVAKYAWHLPLYRQAQMLLAQGLDIKRSILAFWVGYAAAELKPLYLRLREIILASGKIAVDETVAPVLDPGRGRTKKGYFWAIARDDRPWGGTDPPAIAYSYAPGRGAVHALKLLEYYRGIVQCDGYAAYKTIAAKPAMRRSRSPSVGRICGGGSSTSPRAATRRSPARRWSASPRSMRSRRRSEERAPSDAARAPGAEPATCLGLKTWFEQQLTSVSGKSVIARSHPLRLESLGRAHPLPR